ncbi:Peptidase M23 domain-containing protein [Bordetella sputigena]|uniref:M23 family metallopeptidase n=1 Tax=Bordetella sputigena TaxID=1416810 RepID=UPI0039EE26E5
MHARRGSAGHFTLEGGRLALLMSGALLLAALAGALVSRGLAPASVLPVARAGAVPQDPQPGYSDDALHQALAMLAAKVGTLQARLAGVDALSRRLAIAAGVPLPETFAPVADVAQAMDNGAPSDGGADGEADGGKEIAGDGRAQALGRDVDVLADELAGRMAALQLFDMALTRRRADLARLPSSLPVTDYPYLSSSYGWRRHPVTGRYLRHDGLDFAAPMGTPILAAAGGVVVAAGPDAGYGQRVDIDHGDGLLSRYAHASEVLVKAGDLVERGQLIARVGSSGVSTGPHLHFEIRLGGQAMDPRLFLGRPPTAPPALAAATATVVR